MNVKSLEQELKNNAYPGRGIVIGETADGRKAVTAYFIMEEARTAATAYLWRMATASAPRPLILQS